MLLHQRVKGMFGFIRCEHGFGTLGHIGMQIDRKQTSRQTDYVCVHAFKLTQVYWDSPSVQGPSLSWELAALKASEPAPILVALSCHENGSGVSTTEHVTCWLRRPRAVVVKVPHPSVRV